MRRRRRVKKINIQEKMTLKTTTKKKQCGIYDGSSSSSANGTAHRNGLPNMNSLYLCVICDLSLDRSFAVKTAKTRYSKLAPLAHEPFITKIRLCTEAAHCDRLPHPTVTLSTEYYVFIFLSFAIPATQSNSGGNRGKCTGTATALFMIYCTLIGEECKICPRGIPFHMVDTRRAATENVT